MLCGQIYGLRECDVDEVSVLRDGGIRRLFVDMSVVSRMVFGERSKLDTRFAPFHFLFYSTISPFFSPVPPSCLPILPCSVTPETEGRGSEIRNCTEQWPALWDPFSLAWGCDQPYSSDVWSMLLLQLDLEEEYPPYSQHLNMSLLLGKPELEGGCFVWQSDHTKEVAWLPVSEVGDQDGKDADGWHRLDFLFSLTHPHPNMLENS